MTLQADPTPASRHAVARRLAAHEIIDLALLAGFVLLLPLLPQLPGLVRVPLGLLAALFAPGYALVAAAFPRPADFDLIARAALSFGLSIALLPVLALLLNALPWGLQPGPMLLVLALATLLLCGVAAVRRWWVSPSERHDPVTPATLAAPPRRARQLIGPVVGALVIIAVLAGAAFVVGVPHPAAQLTEFYALGAEGRAESYAREVVAGEAMHVRLGIANHEAAAMRYRIEVRAGNGQLIRAGPITLAPGATYEQPISYALAHAGNNQQIDILLYANDGLEPYRQLHLWVDVRATP